MSDQAKPQVDAASQVRLFSELAEHADDLAACPQAATTAAPVFGEREICITIRPHGLYFWQYEGTRAQLEAEGVIPPATEWPQGTQRQYWDDSRFSWYLRRTRPAGMKGPMKLWISGDWWCLCCDELSSPIDRGAARRIMDKARDLAKELHRQTPAGQREQDAASARYWQAYSDKSFQAFKSLIPGLIPPKRGRQRVHAAADAQLQGGRHASSEGGAA